MISCIMYALFSHRSVAVSKHKEVPLSEEVRHCSICSLVTLLTVHCVGLHLKHCARQLHKPEIIVMQIRSKNKSEYIDLCKVFKITLNPTTIHVFSDAVAIVLILLPFFFLLSVTHSAKSNYNYLCGRSPEALVVVCTYLFFLVVSTQRLKNDCQKVQCKNKVIIS